MATLATVMTLIEALKKDEIKVAKKQKAACRRSRVNSMKLIHALREYRKELLDKYKK